MRFNTGDVATLDLTMNAGSLRVLVVLLEARSNFGRTDWRITPVRGSETAWVSEAALSSPTDEDYLKVIDRYPTLRERYPTLREKVKSTRSEPET